MKSLRVRMRAAGIDDYEMTDILECAWWALKYGPRNPLGEYLDLNDEYLNELRDKVYALQNDNLGEDE